ncbi:MAG: pentapeptide repeat-containing protein, partial [Akkermansiaceae bacterium]
MQNATLRIFKKDGKKVSGKCGGILLILKLIIGLFPVLQRRVAFLALFACSFPPLYADHESENVGPGANLSGADLSGDNLFGANLSNADLSNANLTGTNL